MLFKAQKNFIFSLQGSTSPTDMAAELDLRPKGIPNLEEMDEQKVDQLEEKKMEWIQKVMTGYKI